MMRWTGFPPRCTPAMVLLQTCLLALACAFTVPAPVQAAELAGKKLDDSISLHGSVLTLNGLGLRRSFLFRIYVIGLYVPHKSSNAAELIAQRGAKRLALRMISDVGARTFVEALDKGFQANHSEQQLATLKARIGSFRDIIKELGTAREGDAIDLEYLPDSGTRVMVNGTQRGESIQGRDFYEALLRIYLGENPVDDDLKKGLLGLKR